jgi:hypothetical protein
MSLHDSAARAPLGGRHLRQRAGLGLVGGEGEFVSNWRQMLHNFRRFDKPVRMSAVHPQTLAAVVIKRAPAGGPYRHRRPHQSSPAPRTGRFVAPGSYMRGAASSCQPCAVRGAFCSARMPYTGLIATVARISPALRRARGVL